VFHIKVVEKIKTHILCSVTFFFYENHALYEIMSKNAVEPESHRWQCGGAFHAVKKDYTPASTNQRPCTNTHPHTHSPTRATHTNTHTHRQKCVRLTAFPLQQWFQLVSLLRFMYVASVSNIIHPFV
jgi:hypothetical protein